MCRRGTTARTRSSPAPRRPQQRRERDRCGTVCVRWTAPPEATLLRRRGSAAAAAAAYQGRAPVRSLHLSGCNSPAWCTQRSTAERATSAACTQKSPSFACRDENTHTWPQTGGWPAILHTKLVVVVQRQHRASQRHAQQQHSGRFTRRTWHEAEELPDLRLKAHVKHSISFI